MGLPIHDSIVLVDSETLHAEEAISFRGSGLEGPVDTATFGERISVVGVAPGGIATIDLSDGEVGFVRRPTGIGLAGGGLSTDQSGDLYLTADYGEATLSGTLLKLDGTDLSVEREVRLPLGQVADIVQGEDGRLWGAVQVEKQGIYAIGADSEVDLVPLTGGPQDVILGVEGNLLVSLYFRDVILEVTPEGELGRSIAGLKVGPWGMAADEAGTGVVVTEGTPRVRGRIYFVDFKGMRILDSVEVTDCQIPREPLLLNGRVFVTCIGPPGLAVFDVESKEHIGFVPFMGIAGGDPASYQEEQPRGLSVLDLSGARKPG